MNKYFLLLIISLFIFPCSASPFEGPLQVKNQFPLFLHIDAPYLESASAGNSFSSSLSHSSVFMVKSSQEWSVNLDMEITELDLRYKKMIGNLAEFGIEVPVLDFGSGFMDDFLNSYHKFFGFPDYGRSTRPENSFLYEVRRNGSLVIRGENGHIGLGDIRLTAKREIIGPDPVISIRAEIELPTGDASRGYGSGSFDTGVTLLADKRISEKIMTYWNLGVVFPGKLKAQESIPLKIFGHAGAGIEADIWKHISLLAQILFQNSPFPKTEISSIDRVSALLTLGGRYSSGRKSLEFSLTEDPNTAGAPDVTLNLAYKLRF
jgi:hypothetical protein